MRLFTAAGSCRLLFIVLLLLCSKAQAENIKLVSFQYPPLVYAEGTQIKGIASHLVREIFATMGLEVEIEILPWARALQYIEHGQADGIFTIFKNPEREAFLRYTDQYLIEQIISLYTLTDKPITYRGQLKDLEPYPIGVTRAVSYGLLFDRYMQEGELQLTFVNDEESKFQLLDKERVKVVVSSIGIAEFYLQKLDIEGRIMRLPFEIERVPSYIAFSKASPHQDLAPQFEAALTALKRSGRYQQILEQYGRADR